MLRVLAGAALMARLACQRLEVNWEICLAAWRALPAIEVVVECPADRRARLQVRLDEVFPY